MQRRRSHVDDANSSLAVAQAFEATVAKEVVGGAVQPDGRATIKGSQTTRTQANNAAERHAQGLGPRCCGTGTAGPGRAPARPSPAIVQWAAKVAFFKLKLDQLMDSLCRVCLAESKQNLEDKKPNSHPSRCPPGAQCRDPPHLPSGYTGSPSQDNGGCPGHCVSSFPACSAGKLLKGRF